MKKKIRPLRESGTGTGTGTGTAAVLGILILSLLAASCGSAPDPVGPEQAAPAEAAEAQPRPERPEQPEQPEQRVETVYLVSAERSFFADGTLDSVRIFTYADEGGNPISEDLYDADGMLLEREVYLLSPEGRITERKSLEADGTARTIRRFRYDDAGRLLEETLFNTREEPQSASVYEYDEEGRKLRWSVHSGTGDLLGYTEYRYEGGNRVRADNFAPDGILEEYFKTSYDRENLPVRIEQFDTAGRRREYRTLEYQGGKLFRESWHRVNGSVRRSVIYRNNPAGYPEVISFMDGESTLRERREREYLVREIIKPE